MEAELGLSVAALQRRDDQLPLLLRAVRRRGERRRRRRAAVAALLVLVVVALGRWFGSRAVAPVVPPSLSGREVVVVPPGTRPVAGPFAGPVAAGTRAVVVAGSATTLATVVHDDPTIVARYRVALPTRREWFVDDADLQELLRADGRAAGLVHLGGQTLVQAAVVDPYDAP